MPTNHKEYMRKYYQDHKDKFLEHALSKVNVKHVEVNY